MMLKRLSHTLVEQHGDDRDHEADDETLLHARPREREVQREAVVAAGVLDAASRPRP